MFFNKVHGWLRSCGRCGTTWGDIDLYCEICWENLYSQLCRHGEFENNYFFKLNRLWRWSTSNQAALSHLIYSLKGGGNPQVYWRLAKILSASALCRNKTPFQPVFVAAPAKKFGDRDHAYCLARALGDLWVAPVTSGLTRISRGSQKTKSRWNRHELRMGWKDEKSMTPPNRAKVQTVTIFVDDVVTTGATANAAYKALERPENFEVWCLVERSLLHR